GLIAGTGMFIAFFANITVLPALLTVMPVLKPRTHGKGGFGLALHFASVRPMFRSFINLNSRAVCWAALAVGVVAALALPKASFDFDPLNLKDPKTESVATIFDLMADNRASSYSVSILMDNLESARALAKKISALPEVDAATTIADYVPTEQEEKLEIISSMALFLAPSFAGDSFYRVPTLYDHQVAMHDFRIRLAKLVALKGGEAKAAGRLNQALAGLVGAGPYNIAKLKALEKRLLSALPGRLDGLRAALQAEPVSLASLPAEITEGQVSKDGKVRLEIYAKGNLRERHILARFVAAVRGAAPKASGSSVVILEAGNTVIKAFWQAGAISISLISVLLIVVLGRWRDAVLVFAPLVLSALLTVAAGVVFDLPFNFANIIVLPLLFGLGVASGIHLILREREEHGVSAVLDTSTPRAVVFSALTTIGSFASIALSSHPGTSSMGQLLGIAIALTLGCTLVVLPALMNVTAGNVDPTG
ncbi:MAG: MMPL family transporter, partial [Rhodospirillales bacterium]